MDNSKNGKYYNAIMGNDRNSFKNFFERKWIDYINNFPTVHKNATQLRIGNRLRPCLVCWGYALSTSSCEEMDFEKIIDLAIGMELIHKGSIIIDDYIDGDFARKGKITFHKEYSSNEAIIFLLFLLGKATEQLAKFVKYDQISNLICSMSEGALTELCLSNNDLFETAKIDKIVRGETIALITDSLLFGYEINKCKKSEMNVILERIAYKCAYNFQLLNDLEPFSGFKENIKYKNNHNFDVEKNRKNIVITRLYQQCTNEDKNIIITHLKDGELFNILIDLIEKYNLKSLIIKDVEKSKMEINKDLLGLSSLINNKECLEDFLVFINETINQCYLRV